MPLSSCLFFAIVSLLVNSYILVMIKIGKTVYVSESAKIVFKITNQYGAIHQLMGRRPIGRNMVDKGNKGIGIYGVRRQLRSSCGAA